MLMECQLRWALVLIISMCEPMQLDTVGKKLISIGIVLVMKDQNIIILLPLWVNIITVNLVVHFVPMQVITSLMLHCGKELVVLAVMIVVVLILECRTSIESLLLAKTKVLMSEFAPLKGFLKNLF